MGIHGSIQDIDAANMGTSAVGLTYDLTAFLTLDLLEAKVLCTHVKRTYLILI